MKKLVQKFEVSYLPDASACVSRVREANDHTKAGLSDPISGCEWFLFSDFDNFSDIHELVSLRPEARIMGYPAFVDCMLLQRKWIKPRPVFNFSMQGAVVCITGFRDRHTIVSNAFTTVREYDVPNLIAHFSVIKPLVLTEVLIIKVCLPMKLFFENQLLNYLFVVSRYGPKNPTCYRHFLTRWCEGN